MKTAIIIIVIILVLIVVSLFFLIHNESKKRIISKFLIKDFKVTPKDNLDYKGIHIVFFSDVHIGKYMKKEELKKNIEQLKSLNADIYLFGGDLIGKKPYLYYSLEDVKECFAPLLDKCCITIYGNHEFKKERKMSDEYKRQMLEATGFHILNDEEYTFIKNNESISIYGMMENIYHNPKLPNKKYDLVLSHEGDIIDQTSDVIMLSGHTHGGQMIIPHFPVYYRPKHGKKYRYGMYDLKDRTLIVSSGLGFGGLKMRMFVPSEIIEIDYQK